MVNGGVDHLRVGKGAIGGQAHHMVGRKSIQRADEAGLHVLKIAAEDGDAFSPDNLFQGVVTWVGAGGHDDAVDTAGSGHAFDLAHDHRRAAKGQHHLAGQPA